jgi:GNAT superfamily N-acetyltransferase
MSLNPAATLRKLRPDESGLYRDFLLSLDPQTRRDRFCGGVSDAYLSQYAQRSLNSNALLYGCFQDGQLCGVGELHADAPGEPAEAAFVVSPDARHHGIGAALLDVIVLAARNRNHPVIRVTCLRTNEAMRRLAKKADARLVLTYDEAAGEIYAPRPNALSWLREAFADAFDTVIYTMRLPLKEPRAT